MINKRKPLYESTNDVEDNLISIFEYIYSDIITDIKRSNSPKIKFDQDGTYIHRMTKKIEGGLESEVLDFVSNFNTKNDSGEFLYDIVECSWEAENFSFGTNKNNIILTINSVKLTGDSICQDLYCNITINITEENGVLTKGQWKCEFEISYNVPTVQEVLHAGLFG